jgi:branched-chain amino acid transport system substrate-binding protein
MRKKEWIGTGVLLLALCLPVFGNGTGEATDGTESIRLGFFCPLTGGTAQAGQAALNGAQMAVEEVNERGGVLGRQIKIIAYDDKSSPEEAVKVATKLVQVDKVDAIFGSLHSGNILAAADVIENSKTVLVSGGTSPTWLQQGYRYLFRSIANNTYTAIQLAKFAQNRGYSRIALFTSNDEYGVTGGKSFVKASEGMGFSYVAEESFTHGDRDFTGQFAKIIGTKPDAIVIWGLGDDLGFVAKQLRQFGYAGPVLGCESWANPEALQSGGNALEDVYFASQYLTYSDPNDAEDPAMKSFLTGYIDEFGSAPMSDNAFRAYDGVHLIVKAMRDGNCTRGEELRESFNNIDGYVGLAGTFSYKGKQGEGIETQRIYTVRNGKYVEVK